MSIHEQIRDIILKHKGKENGIISEKIAEKVGIEPGPSTISIREKITETMKLFGIPIGAGQKGYYLITNKNELKDYLTFLDKKIEGNKNRQILVNIAYYRYHKDEEIELSSEIIEEDLDDEDDTGDFMMLEK